MYVLYTKQWVDDELKPYVNGARKRNEKTGVMVNPPKPMQDYPEVFDDDLIRCEAISSHSCNGYDGEDYEYTNSLPNRWKRKAINKINSVEHLQKVIADGGWKSWGSISHPHEFTYYWVYMSNDRAIQELLLGEMKLGVGRTMTSRVKIGYSDEKKKMTV